MFDYTSLMLECLTPYSLILGCLTTGFFNSCLNKLSVTVTAWVWLIGGCLTADSYWDVWLQIRIGIFDYDFRHNQIEFNSSILWTHFGGCCQLIPIWMRYVWLQKQLGITSIYLFLLLNFCDLCGLTQNKNGLVMDSHKTFPIGFASLLQSWSWWLFSVWKKINECNSNAIVPCQRWHTLFLSVIKKIISLSWVQHPKVSSEYQLIAFVWIYFFRH